MKANADRSTETVEKKSMNHNEVAGSEKKESKSRQFRIGKKSLIRKEVTNSDKEVENRWFRKKKCLFGKKSLVKKKEVAGSEEKNLAGSERSRSFTTTSLRCFKKKLLQKKKERKKSSWFNKK